MGLWEEGTKVVSPGEGAVVAWAIPAPGDSGGSCSSAPQLGSPSHGRLEQVLRGQIPMPGSSI